MLPYGRGELFLKPILEDSYSHPGISAVVICQGKSRPVEVVETSWVLVLSDAQWLDFVITSFVDTEEDRHPVFDLLKSSCLWASFLTASVLPGNIL